MFCILFLKSQNKCRCFLLKWRVQSVYVLPTTAASHRSPVIAVWCPTLVSIAAVSRVGIATLPQSVVSVCWCVVMVCLCVGRRGPATDSRLQWLLLLSSPAVCSVQQHGPARSTEQQGRIYSPAALHRRPPHPTGNTRSYEATMDTYTRYTLIGANT